MADSIRGGNKFASQEEMSDVDYYNVEELDKLEKFGDFTTKFLSKCNASNATIEYCHCVMSFNATFLSYCNSLWLNRCIKLVGVAFGYANATTLSLASHLI